MRTLYRGMEQSPSNLPRADLEYRVEGCSGPDGFCLQDNDGPRTFAQTAGGILSALEDALTIALQLQRPDLLFVHAAAVADKHGAMVFVGPSGAGKSTLAWALTRHRHTYLSDELAPFDPSKVAVAPFARAIHLKTEPPGAPSLPSSTVDTGPTLCVPVDSLEGGVADAPDRLHTLFFLAPSPRPAVPEIRELTSGDAVSRLFANTLNALAHPSYGVDAAVRIVRQARCYELSASELDATCALVGLSCQ